MKKIRNFICCLIVFIFVTPTAGISSGATFFDIDESVAYKVEMVTDMGFLYYDLVPYFSPDKIITRKEAAEIMYILDKGYFYNDGGTNYINNFKDVYKNDYVINYCRENGLVSGYLDNTYKPNNPVTYAEIIEMFVKTLGFEDERVLENPDEYIKVAGYKGLLNDVEFEPDDYVTNLNAALLVFNALTLPMYPVKGKQNLQETGFAELYKLTLQTNDRIERMLVMYEEFGIDSDIVLLNLDLEMIINCYKDLSSININCEFKYNHSVQFLRKVNGYINTIAKLNKEVSELEGMDAYLDFARYSSLGGEYYDCLMLLNSEMNYDERYSNIMLNVLYTMNDMYEELIFGIESRLPKTEHFAESFNGLEIAVLDAFGNEFKKNNIPLDFYEEENWISELIYKYNETEEFFNFMSENNLMDGNFHYYYYDRMLELTYIIKSMYFIMGYEYSITTTVDNELELIGEYYSASRDLLNEMKQMSFIYYDEQIGEILNKLSTITAMIL